MKATEVGALVLEARQAERRLGRGYLGQRGKHCLNTLAPPRRRPLPVGEIFEHEQRRFVVDTEHARQEVGLELEIHPALVPNPPRTEVVDGPFRKDTPAVGHAHEPPLSVGVSTPRVTPALDIAPEQPLNACNRRRLRFVVQAGASACTV
jgi:hypothetical protein